MTKRELFQRLESVPDDHEIDVVATEGPHASIVNVVSHDKDERTALLIELRRPLATPGWSKAFDLRIEVMAS